MCGARYAPLLPLGLEISAIPRDDWSSDTLDVDLRSRLEIFARRVAHLLISLGGLYAAALATTFDLKVARDPVRDLTSTSRGLELLVEAHIAFLARHAGKNPPVEIIDSVWDLDDPHVSSLRAWATQRLDSHAAFDLSVSALIWARRPGPTDWTLEEAALASARKSAILASRLSQ